MLQPFTWGAQNPIKVQYIFPLAIGIININNKLLQSTLS